MGRVHHNPEVEPELDALEPSTDGCVGYCTSCKLEVYPPNHCKHTPAQSYVSKGKTYYRHNECQKTDVAFRSVNELLDFDAKAFLMGCSREQKLQWYHQYGGIIPQLATAVKASFEQTKTEKRQFTAAKNAKGYTDAQLREIYLDKGRADEYHSIKAKAQTTTCPVAGTKWYFVPEYSLTDIFRTDETETMHRGASQDQVAKAAAKRKVLNDEQAAALKA